MGQSTQVELDIVEGRVKYARPSVVMEGRPLSQYGGEGERCAFCPAILSRYNKSCICRPCLGARAKAIITAHPHMSLMAAEAAALKSAGGMRKKRVS